MSADKRRRLPSGQSPTTPAKADSKMEPAEAADQGQTANLDRPESPILELSDGEADVEPDIGLSPNTRIQVQSFGMLYATDGTRFQADIVLCVPGALARAAPYQART